MKLARERENQEMSAADAARALRLSVKQIEALESDQLDSLPGRTFVRGFVRNYARLLNLDPDQLVAEYLPPQPEMEVQHIQAPSQQISFSEHQEKPWLKWLASGFVVVALASWGVLAWLGPETARPVVAPKEDVPAAPSAPVQSEEPASLPASPVVAAPPGEAGTVGGALPQTQPSKPVNSVLARATLSFSGTSWVEARDRSGKKIYSQNNLAGTQQILEGEPPLSLVIGSAPNVKLTYKGQPVDLAAYTKADVARLSLE